MWLSCRCSSFTLDKLEVLKELYITKPFNPFPTLRRRHQGIVSTAVNDKHAEIFFATVPAAGHDMGGHPECAARVPAILKALKKHQLTEGQYSDKVLGISSFSPAPIQTVLSVHTNSYLKGLERYSKDTLTDQASILESGAPTYGTCFTYENSLKAVGAAMALVDAVVTSAEERVIGSSGFGICRPPGHHALPSGPMGFCIFGTVAIAVRYAQQKHNLKKILVYDFDVHHGNGTQDIFYNDPSVLFISSHQLGSYPGTGKMTETGSGDGEGTTINIQLPIGSGEKAALSTFDDIIAPAAEHFQPDMIFVSAGYDAHFLDPLENLQFTASTYNALCRRLKELANKLCKGRLVLLLEGGYHLDALGESVADSFRGLLGLPSIDTFNKACLHDEPQSKVQSMIQEIQRIHNV